MRILTGLGLAVLALPLMAQKGGQQINEYAAAFTSPDGGVTWNPVTSSSTTGVWYPNAYVGLMGYNATTGNWYPCTTANPCMGAGSGGSAPPMAKGQITLSGGSGSATFSTAFTSTPTCTATDTSAIAAVRITSTSTTTLTISGTGSDVINYLCF